MDLGSTKSLLGHVCLYISPALLDLAEDGRVAADDGDAGHQEAEQHEELLRRFIVFPEGKTRLIMDHS